MKRLREPSKKNVSTAAMIKTERALLECVRLSGRWNMFTQYQSACETASALALRFDQTVRNGHVSLTFEEYAAGYSTPRKAKQIADAAARLLGDRDAAALFQEVWKPLKSPSEDRQEIDYMRRALNETISRICAHSTTMKGL